MQRMGKVSIDDLQPGMVLAADALANDNRVLLKAGATIQDKHIRVLKSWGLLELDVQGVSREALEALSIAKVDRPQWEAAQEQVKHMFRHTDASHPAVGELLYIATLRRLDRVFKGE